MVASMIRMPSRFIFSACPVAAYLLMFGLIALIAGDVCAQNAPPAVRTPRQAAGPAPKRDLSGIWKPAIGAQGSGAAAMPADGKPEHELPFTPLGAEMAKRTK